MSRFGDPRFLVKLHMWLTIFWAMMMPFAILTELIYVIAFVSVISIYANFGAHYSSWQAARTEVKQIDADKINAEQDEELHRRLDEIYDRIVKDDRR